MIWLKRILVLFITIFFLGLLLAFSLVTSLVLALSHPTKIENWLSHSQLYSSVLGTTVDQASTVISSNLHPYGITISQATVQKFATKAFTPADLQQYTATFINANYAWLKGTTATPQFTIDLTPVKQAFAQQAGQYISARLVNIPSCTASQTTTALLSNNFQALSCLPAGISPSSAGNYIAQQLLNSKQFIGNDVITAQTLSPNLNAKAAQPYYKKISQAPTYYQAAEKLPYVIGGLALLSAIGVIFLSSSKRRGLRRIAIYSIEIGVLLLIITSLSSIAFAAAKNAVISQNNSQIIEQSLLSVINQIEIQINHANNRIGEGYIAFGVLVIIILLATIRRQKKLSTEQKSFLHDSSNHLMAPYLDKDSEEESPQPKTPPKRKRFIQ